MVGARTGPEGGGLPVVVVVREAGEAGQAAVVSLPLSFLLLPLLLASPDLVVQLSPAVDFLRGLPVGHKQRDDCKDDIRSSPACQSQEPQRRRIQIQRGTSRRPTDARMQQSVYFHVEALNMSNFLGTVLISLSARTHSRHG